MIMSMSVSMSVVSTITGHGNDIGAFLSLLIRKVISETMSSESSTVNSVDAEMVSIHNVRSLNTVTNSHQPTVLRPFALKKWNALATWAWDVDCDTCAICRVQLMEECLRCQAEASTTDCVVVWGECNHAFHNCCMSQWVRQNNRCPLCQQDWIVQRVGR
ncbi:zinc finger, C3HC4 type [Dictyocaulus viviparus]|uniref:RING-box protein 2 n=1 Tax=Dictyocaulus viviparus TaxID=29172 RepID=A0A0D8XV91_DICVI|nr:zinc finger, C3HC4 type [Dictyocaulus viviparus]